MGVRKASRKQKKWIKDIQADAGRSTRKVRDPATGKKRKVKKLNRVEASRVIGQAHREIDGR